MLDMLTNLTSGGVGALLGSFLTVLLQRKAERQAKREVRASRLRHAQFTLLAQCDHLQNLSTKMEPLRRDPDRWRKLNPSVGGPKLALDFQSLSFVLDSSTPQILYNLFLGEVEYETFKEALGLRGRLRIDLSARLSQLERTGFDLDADPARTEAMVGKDLLIPLKAVSDDLYEVMDRARNAKTTNLNQVAAFMRKEYPEESPLTLGAFEPVKYGP